MGAEESLFKCLEQVPDPRRARGVRHPFQAILRLTLLGLVCGQTTMAHIALFAKMHWPVLREPLGFLRDDPPHATTISRTLAGVPCEQLQGALTGWVARVAADQELDASVDGKWAKQSEDAQGNPLVMVNVLAHDLKLCLAQWPASEKRYEPSRCAIRWRNAGPGPAATRRSGCRSIWSSPGLFRTGSPLPAFTRSCRVGSSPGAASPTGTSRIPSRPSGRPSTCRRNQPGVSTARSSRCTRASD